MDTSVSVRHELALHAMDPNAGTWDGGAIVYFDGPDFLAFVADAPVKAQQDTAEQIATYLKSSAGKLKAAVANASRELSQLLLADFVTAAGQHLLLKSHGSAFAAGVFVLAHADLLYVLTVGDCAAWLIGPNVVRLSESTRVGGGSILSVFEKSGNSSRAEEFRKASYLGGELRAFCQSDVTILSASAFQRIALVSDGTEQQLGLDRLRELLQSSAEAPELKRQLKEMLGGSLMDDVTMLVVPLLPAAATSNDLAGQFEARLQMMQENTWETMQTMVENLKITQEQAIEQIYPKLGELADYLTASFNTSLASKTEPLVTKAEMRQELVTLAQARNPQIANLREAVTELQSLMAGLQSIAGQCNEHEQKLQEIGEAVRTGRLLDDRIQQLEINFSKTAATPSNHEVAKKSGFGDSSGKSPEETSRLDALTRQVISVAEQVKKLEARLAVSAPIPPEPDRLPPADSQKPVETQPGGILGDHLPTSDNSPKLGDPQGEEKSPRKPWYQAMMNYFERYPLRSTAIAVGVVIVFIFLMIKVDELRANLTRPQTPAQPAVDSSSSTINSVSNSSPEGEDLPKDPKPGFVNSATIVPAPQEPALAPESPKTGVVEIVVPQEQQRATPNDSIENQLVQEKQKEAEQKRETERRKEGAEEKKAAEANKKEKIPRPPGK